MTMVAVIFVYTYSIIALDIPCKINKSATALIAAGLMWTFILSVEAYPTLFLPSRNLPDPHPGPREKGVAEPSQLVESDGSLGINVPNDQPDLIRVGGHQDRQAGLAARLPGVDIPIHPDVNFIGQRLEPFLQVSDDGLLLPGKSVQKAKLLQEFSQAFFHLFLLTSGMTLPEANSRVKPNSAPQRGTGREAHRSRCLTECFDPKI